MKNSAKVNIVLLVLVFVMACIIYFLLSGHPRFVKIPAADSGLSWNAQKQLDFAETLASKGLKKEALAAFDDYLKLARLSAIESAKLLYRMGNMYMELLDYEKALYYFYKSQAADPNTGFKAQLDAKLVECLENLGMTAQARYELASRSSLGPEQDKTAGGAVLARVAGEDITETEIDEAINSMPDWAKESFSQAEGRLEFVRQYATTQALYKKAKMLGLDKDVDVRRGIKDITKQLLVQKLLEVELKGKINIDPADIQTYYQANKDRYTEEAALTASVIKLSSTDSAQDVMRRLQAGADFAKMVKEFSADDNTKAKDGLVEGDISENGYIPNIGTSKEATEAMFSKKQADIVGPIKIGEAYYIFRINSITPQIQRSFEEVKEQVEYEYKNKKAQDEMQSLLKDVLQEEQVEIFNDRILGKEAKEKPKSDAEQNKSN